MNSNNKMLYGINSCFDLYNKLKYEGENLEGKWNVYNTFNFIVTAWHLHHDWLNADVEHRPKLATKKKEQPKTPPDMMKIVFALRDITNSSKHSFLDEDSVKKKVVTNIHSPLIGDWASYFLHGPMIYVEIENAIFSMWDLRHIVLLYFDWIFDDSVPANQFPTEIQEHLKRCSIKKSEAQPELPGTRPPIWFFGASRLENQTFDRQIFPNNQQLRYHYPVKICPSTRALAFLKVR